jgi:predicted component of type VI protein secretion system
MDEQGFSNEKIKESIKDNIIEIKNTIKGEE